MNLRQWLTTGFRAMRYRRLFQAWPSLIVVLIAAVIISLFPAALFGRHPEKNFGLIEIEDKKAYWISELTDLPPQRHHAGREPIIAQYQVSWSGMLAAGRIDLELSPPHAPDDALWSGRVAVRSTGAASRLWPYYGEARALIREKTLLPHWFRRTQTERGVTKEYTGEYNGTVMVVESTAWKNGKRMKSRVETAYKYRRIRDPISTILLLREVQMTPGDQISVLVQPSDRLYLVTFFVLGKEWKQISGSNVETVKLSLGIRRVEDDLSLSKYSRMLRGTIWVEDDRDRIPVEMHVELPLGFVSARKI